MGCSHLAGKSEEQNRGFPRGRQNPPCGGGLGSCPKAPGKGSPGLSLSLAGCFSGRTLTDTPARLRFLGSWLPPTSGKANDPCVKLKPVRGVRSPTARTPEVGLGVCGAGRPPGFYSPNPLFSVPKGDQPRPRFSCRLTNCREVASSPRHSLPTTAGAGVRGSAAEKAVPTPNMGKTRTSGRGQAASSGPCVSGILSTNAAGSREPRGPATRSPGWTPRGAGVRPPHARKWKESGLFWGPDGDPTDSF